MGWCVRQSYKGLFFSCPGNKVLRQSSSCGHMIDAVRLYLQNEKVLVDEDGSAVLAENDDELLLCMRTRGGSIEWSNSLRDKGQLVLCNTSINQRRLGLLVMLFLCQGLGMLAALHLLFQMLCEGSSECYLYVSPAALLFAAVSMLRCLTRYCDLHDEAGLGKMIFQVDNGIIFWVSQSKAKAEAMRFHLDTQLSSKAYYGPHVGCPISLLHCRWPSAQSASQCFKIACYTLPEHQEELHIPITCDAINILFHELAADIRKQHMLEQSVGILVISSTGKQGRRSWERFLVFLFKSGFSILCNVEACGVIIAMRNLSSTRPPSSACRWVMEEALIDGENISVKLKLEG